MEQERAPSRAGEQSSELEQTRKLLETEGLCLPFPLKALLDVIGREYFAHSCLPALRLSVY